FGKGSVQSVNPLNDGGELRITNARFFSPADVEINRVGVAPDIVFEFTPDILGSESDEAVLRAIDFLKTGQ
ncbi:MAG: S41 family peptidase, partial [Candidatus Promineifilaceae bacterium]